MTMLNRLAGYVVIGTLVVMGFLDRLWLLAHVPLNSDEAIVLLQTEGLLHGHFVSFYWGQFYGAGQPYVALPLAFLLGSKPWVMRFSGVLLSAVIALIVWRIARRVLHGRFSAAMVAALSFVLPFPSVLQFTYAYGFRPVTYLCAWLCVLLSLQVTQKRSGLWRWVLLGFVSGVGWWSSPEVVWGVLPALFIVLDTWRHHWERRRVSREFLSTLGGFLAGAFVWLWVSVTSRGATLKPQASQSGIARRFVSFFEYVLPQQFGLRQYGPSAETLSHRGLTLVLYLGMLVILVAASYWAIRLGGCRRALGLTAACSPIVFAINPATWYWADGRYALFLAPLYLLVVGIGVEAILTRRNVKRPLALRGAIAILVCGIFGLSQMVFISFADSLPPTPAFGADNGARSAAVALVDHGVTAGWADYWLAYRLDAMSTGTLHLSPIPGDLDRVVSDRLITQVTHRRTWIFSGGGDGTVPQGSAMGPAEMKFSSFAAQLKSRDISWSTRRIAGFWVVNLSKFVAPESLNS